MVERTDRFPAHIHSVYAELVNVARLEISVVSSVFIHLVQKRTYVYFDMYPVAVRYGFTVFKERIFAVQIFCAYRLYHGAGRVRFETVVAYVVVVIIAPAVKKLYAEPAEIVCVYALDVEI